MVSSIESTSNSIAWRDAGKACEAHSGDQKADKGLKNLDKIINELPNSKDDDLLHHILQFVGVDEEQESSTRAVTKRAMVRAWMTLQAGGRDPPADKVEVALASATNRTRYANPEELFGTVNQKKDSAARSLMGIFRLACINNRFAKIAEFAKRTLDKNQLTLSMQGMRWSIECGVNLRLVEFNLWLIENNPAPERPLPRLPPVHDLPRLEVLAKFEEMELPLGHALGRTHRPLLHAAVHPMFAKKPSKRLISSILLLDEKLPADQKQINRKDALGYDFGADVVSPLSAHCRSPHYDVDIARKLLEAKPDEGPQSFEDLLRNPSLREEDKFAFLALVKQHTPSKLLTHIFRTIDGSRPNLIIHLILVWDCKALLELLRENVPHEEWLAFINFATVRGDITAAHYLCSDRNFNHFSANFYHLIDHSADLSVRAKRSVYGNQTPFMMLLNNERVAIETKIAITRELKRRNINIDAIDGEGASTLQAVCTTMPDFFTWLPIYLEGKTSQQIKDVFNYRCPENRGRYLVRSDFLLNLLCPTISIDNLRFLLEQGADPHLKFADGISAASAYSQNPNACSEGVALLSQ